MNKPALMILVIVLALIYVLAGAASIMELRRQEEFHVGWSLLAAFWLFLAVGIWRLSRIARTISLTLLWVVVLGFSFLAMQPLYFPELQLPGFVPALQRRPEFFWFLVGFALVALWVMGRYKEEFR